MRQAKSCPTPILPPSYSPSCICLLGRGTYNLNAYVLVSARQSSPVMLASHACQATTPLHSSLVPAVHTLRENKRTNSSLAA